MPASKAEQVLEALREVLDLVPGAVVQRNSALPQKIPAGARRREQQHHGRVEGGGGHVVGRGAAARPGRRSTRRRSRP